MTFTLAWLTPVRPHSANYRAIGLELVDADGRSRLWPGVRRVTGQPPVGASKRGTLIHAVYEGTSAVPFQSGSSFELNVQATSRLTGVSGIDIPYALAITIEVAATINADIATSIQQRLRPRVFGRTQ